MFRQDGHVNHADLIAVVDSTANGVHESLLPGSQELIESSLTSLRANVQSALDADAKMMASCKELANRFGAAVK